MLFIAGIEKNPGPFRHNSLKICNVNINSITAENRIDELEEFINQNNIGIVGLCETKLDNSIDDCIYKIRNFHAPITRHRNRRGGGVALYCHSSLAVTRLENLEIGEIEWVWAKIKVNDISLIICCIYIPPHVSAESQDLFLEYLTESINLAQTFNPTNIIVMGDFNAGNLYLKNSFLNHTPITSFERKLYQAANVLGLSQTIEEPTRVQDNTHNLRDLCFVKNRDMLEDQGLLSSFSHLDHFPIYISIKVKIHPPDLASKTVWDYEKMDVNRLTNILMTSNWEDIVDRDIDAAVDEFTTTLLSAAEAAIPSKIISSKSKDKPWMTASIKRSIKKRDRLFKIAKEMQKKFAYPNQPANSNQPEVKIAWQKWREQRNHTTSEIRRHKNIYFEGKSRQLLQCKNNPHKYHSILREMTGRFKENEIPPLVTEKGQIINEEIEKADALNNFFALQSTLEGSDKEIQQSNQPDNPIPEIGPVQITQQEVLNELNNLNSNKSTGPDNIPPKLLKLTALLICEPLSKLFNKSLQVGVFPCSWKLANIKPIFKNKGSPSDISCYRPISLLSCISKIFERIIFRKIYQHLTDNDLLTERQSGYRPGHGTQLQIFYLSHKLYESLDKGQDFTTIYLDISRYFDKIWHKGLLYKCKHEFGLNTLLTWLKSYLGNRKQRVSIRNSHSSLLTLNAGCPQGSVLGPLLALLYLNSLSKLTENDVLSFADDTSLHASFSTDSLQSAQNSLQSDLDKIHQYGQDWLITFNPLKTIQQTFSLKNQNLAPKLHFGGQPIPVVDQHKHLGITFSKDLRYKEHVNKIIRKVNITLSPIYPVAKFLTRSVLDQIYKTYVRPHFDYCDIIYDGHITTYDAIRLERLQNRAARLVTWTHFRTPTDKLKEDLGWENLETRRKMHKLGFLHNLLNNPNIPQYIKNLIPLTRQNETERPLRNSEMRTILEHNTLSFKKSFLPSTIELWNRLSPDVRSTTSKKPFRHKINHVFGAPQPPGYYLIGPKKENSLLTRLRVGMSDLNSHKFIIQAINSPHCSCGHANENPHHFLLKCQVYNAARIEMFNSISENMEVNLNTLTNTNKLKIILHGYGLSPGNQVLVARSVQKFMKDSHRFHSDS